MNQRQIEPEAKVIVNEQLILFAEEDTQFRLMETAVNGSPSPEALGALRYFFGEMIGRPLNALLSFPSLVGLPTGFRAAVCDDEDKLPVLLHKADYLVVEKVVITEQMLGWGKGRLKLVQKFGNNPANIDIEGAKRLGIPVSCLRRVSSVSVAEHVLAMIFALSRKLVFSHVIVKDRIHASDGLSSDGPPRTRYNWGGVEDIRLVSGKTLGLVGFGENAFELAVLARGIGMKILYTQRHRASMDRESAVAARYVPSLRDMLQESHVTSIHVPYGPLTDKMFNHETLSSMKAGSFLINISRGGVVDEASLARVLEEKKIAGAALDVYRWEPVPSDSPLLRLENVIWSPHNAAGAEEFLLQDCLDLLASIARVAGGGLPAA